VNGTHPKESGSNLQESSALGAAGDGRDGVSGIPKDLEIRWIDIILKNEIVMPSMMPSMTLIKC
jgi:hypothetical protein